MEVEKLRAALSVNATPNGATSRHGNQGTAAGDEEDDATPLPVASAAMAAAGLQAPELGALDEWMEDLRVLGQETRRNNRLPLSLNRSPGHVQSVASPMRVRGTPGLRSPSAVSSPSQTLSKREMAQLAEQKALEWSSGKATGHGRISLSPSSKTSQRSQNATPKSSRGGLLGGTLTSELLGGSPVSESENVPAKSSKPASAVETQLDDILKELDEIDRIHDDVCMLAQS